MLGAEAVRLVIAALAGTASAEELAAGLAPRLTARGNLAATTRFAAFREHPATIEDLAVRGEWSVRATVRTGETLWELDVTAEPGPPHRISSFQPRPVAADAVPWAEIEPSLRQFDRWWSTRDEHEKLFEKLRAAVGQHHLVGLSVGIAVDGEVVARGTFGVSDLATSEPLRDDSVFRVGSVTKLVTALAVSRLVADGALSLDAPATRLAGPDGRSPSVRDLLLHRGGLPKDLPVGRELTRLPWSVGERYEYSNVGYGLLGGMIEEAAGIPYGQFCREKIFIPYGLRNAGAPVDVTGYRVAAGRVSPVPPAVSKTPASGGLTASREDLLALALLFSRGEDPLARAASDLRTPAGFMAGAAILDQPGGPVLWRGGATDGFTAEMVVALDNSCTVVLLASKSPPEGLREIALDVIVPAVRRSPEALGPAPD